MTTDTGKSFEALLDMLFKSMRQHGIGRIERTSPPVRVLRKERRGFLVVFQRNKWVDYAGCLRDGTAVVLEAKSSKSKTLKLNTEPGEWSGTFGGVSSKQMRSLEQWWRAGALVGVIFERCGELRLYGSMQLAEATKSVHWDQGVPLEIPSFHHALNAELRANHIEP